MTREKNSDVHLNPKERNRPSYPTRRLLAKGHIQGRVLAFGFGYGGDVSFLEAKGYDVTSYDALHASSYPNGQFDTILCHYLLNLLFRRERSRVLMEVAELLRPSGAAYFTVRRNPQESDFRMQRRRSTSGCDAALPYESVLQTNSCEIYRYRHYNQREHIAARECPFCDPESERDLITESAQTYAMLDKYPVNKGHALVIPKRHVANYFDLPSSEQTASWELVERVQELVRDRYEPDGFNIGVNVDQAGGQTIGHVHIHVIPRYEGDVENPTGGVRNVIPEHGDYTHG